ncbi:MAG TPA: acyltransferase [Polyangiales bacterium]|nr:acyltransferase [Polyangiales bacterium]
MHARQNNFDALRFWAALVVLWSHAFPIAYGSEAHEPLYALSGGQSTLGGVAVSLFFVISGYLITRSFERSESSWTFTRARILRIAPALLVVLAITAFALGPIVSDHSAAEYFRSGAPYRYVLAQASFTRHIDVLSGVFADHALPYVNASLWTLRYEVACYVLVLVLGVSRLLTRFVTLLLYLGAIAYLAVVEHLQTDLHAELPGPDRLLDLGAKFLAGALVYQWRVPLRARWAWLALAVLGFTVWAGAFRSAERIVLPYAVLFVAIGTTRRLPALTRFGDLSYGTYIYAWPVSQCAVLALAEPSWFGVGLIATPIVLALAFASFHLVEKRALAWKAAPVREPEPAFSAWRGPAR